jgi:hypothetical protein
VLDRVEECVEDLGLLDVTREIFGYVLDAE